MAAVPGFDLIASKLRRPSVRSNTIRRPSLLERLTREDSRPVVSVAAPSGYGKTTLLAQWAGQRPRVRGAGLTGELVLDDVHLLHNRDCRDALSVLADHVPGGSRLVLAGRNEPPPRTARLRAQGRILEIGPRDLMLSREEAARLLQAAEVMLSEEDVAALHQRTEGWPTGLYLAALYLREGGAVRVLPLRATHLPFPEIAADLFLSPAHRQVTSDVDLPETRRLLTQPGSCPVPGARPPRGVTSGHSCHWWDAARPGPRCNGRTDRAEDS
jgi:ATP/maltotriose-dependent transcriptional regulator MalT